jgi:hypothetical protein
MGMLRLPEKTSIFKAAICQLNVRQSARLETTIKMSFSEKNMPFGNPFYEQVDDYTRSGVIKWRILPMLTPASMTSLVRILFTFVISLGFTFGLWSTQKRIQDSVDLTESQKKALVGQIVALVIVIPLVFLGEIAQILGFVPESPGLPFLLFFPSGLYLAINAIRHRVSLINFRGNRNPSSGALAAAFGIILLISILGGMFLTSLTAMPALVQRLGLVPPLPAAPPQAGFAMVYLLTDEVGQVLADNLFFLIGAYLPFVFMILILVAAFQSGKKHWASFVVSALFLIVWTLNATPFFQMMFSSRQATYNQLVEAYQNGQYQLAEGVVNVLPVENQGRVDTNYFEIGGVQFLISELDHFGYNTTIAQGGLLTQGTYARVYYLDNDSGRIILRIDLPVSSLQ